MSATVIKRQQLNKFDLGVNSNKVWIGTAYSDGKIKTEWGRIRENAKLQSKTRDLGSSSAAERELERLSREKLAKGYRESQVFGGEREVETAAGSPPDLKRLAAEQIAGCGNDKTTAALVEYLVDVNIHHIEHSSSIRYNAANASFSTPLGVLTPAAISEARSLLALIHKLNQKYKNYPPERAERLADYFQIVPRDFGVKIPPPEKLLPTQKYIRQENSLLDALEASIRDSPADGAEPEKIFKTKLVKIPHWTDEGKAKFREIRALFDKTKNAHHSTHAFKLVALYEVEIEDMKKNFDEAGAKLGNVRSDLWHGTRASNLLSILKNGLRIPDRNSAHCTGRMFGNGIYTSNQSTKALNYATNFWNRSGAAKVKKVLGWNPDTGIARVRVKFRQTVGAVERSVFLAR